MKWPARRKRRGSVTAGRLICSLILISNPRSRTQLVDATSRVRGARSVFDHSNGRRRLQMDNSMPMNARDKCDKLKNGASCAPSPVPSASPSHSPTTSPQPSISPAPSSQPSISFRPSSTPSVPPTDLPSPRPSASASPTTETAYPSRDLSSSMPIVTEPPSITIPATEAPSKGLTSLPSLAITFLPSQRPTTSPTVRTSGSPTRQTETPSVTLSKQPTLQPSLEFSGTPSGLPTPSPSLHPTATVPPTTTSRSPSASPTVSPAPSNSPAPTTSPRPTVLPPSAEAYTTSSIFGGSNGKEVVGMQSKCRVDPPNGTSTLTQVVAFNYEILFDPTAINGSVVFDTEMNLHELLSSNLLLCNFRDSNRGGEKSGFDVISIRSLPKDTAGSDKCNQLAILVTKTMVCWTVRSAFTVVLAPFEATNAGRVRRLVDSAITNQIVYNLFSLSLEGIFGSGRLVQPPIRAMQFVGITNADLANMDGSSANKTDRGDVGGLTGDDSSNQGSKSLNNSAIIGASAAAVAACVLGVLVALVLMRRQHSSSAIERLVEGSSRDAEDDDLINRPIDYTVSDINTPVYVEDGDANSQMHMVDLGANNPGSLMMGADDEPGTPGWKAPSAGTNSEADTVKVATPSRTGTARLLDQEPSYHDEDSVMTVEGIGSSDMGTTSAAVLLQFPDLLQTADASQAESQDAGAVKKKSGNPFSSLTSIFQGKSDSKSTPGSSQPSGTATESQAATQPSVQEPQWAGQSVRKRVIEDTVEL